MTKEQKEFEKKYITSSEICENLGVSRSTLQQARERGLLPEPIHAKGARVYFWERAKVAKHLEAWEITLKAKRGQLI